MMKECLKSFETGLDRVNLVLTKKQIEEIENKIVSLFENNHEICKERCEVNLHRILCESFEEMDIKVEDEVVESLKSYMGYPLKELDIEYVVAAMHQGELIDLCEGIGMDQYLIFVIMIACFRAAMGNEMSLTENQKLITDMLLGPSTPDLQELYSLISEEMNEEEYVFLNEVVNINDEFNDCILCFIYSLYNIEHDDIDIQSRLQKISGSDKKFKFSLMQDESILN